MRALRILLALIPAAAALADEVVYVDGRREATEQAVVKEDAVLVRFERGLRRVAKADVAGIVRDDGSVEVVERTLAEAPLSGAQRTDLAALAELDGPPLLEAQQRLAASLSREVFAALEELAGANQATTRARAAVVLARMGARESVEAAVAVALHDPSADTRREVASALCGIAGLIEVHDLRAPLRPGLEHEDRTARALFALALGAAGDGAAAPVLRADALRHSDHHVRESAAEALARLGDDAGVPLLLKMLRRKSHPTGDPQILVAEKIRVCGHLARLRCKEALPELRKVARSGDPALAAAAQSAVDDIG